jgi:phosphodiesterase/alkaline phosphatase D-like protein
MAHMTIGPVVGKVTDTTARVLVEADADAAVRCVLIDPTETRHEVALALRGGRPAVFAFQGLAPETPYSVTFQGLEARVGRVMTLPSAARALNLAVVSCNFTTQRGETDLWEDLFTRYVATGDVQVVLHLGDQVYGDSAFAEAMYLLDGSATPTRTQERKILQLYRRLYAWSWNHPSTRAVLANASNLMIWDDHEIRDDWGSRSTDRDPATPDFAIGRLARRVYREYQRQLWDDFDTDVDAPGGQLEDHAHRFGEIGVLFVDQRTARSFEHDPTRPYLGTPQWERVTQSLAGGVLSNVRALLVVTSVPLAYLGAGASSAGAAIVDDLMDHWAFRDHQKEQIEMLRALRQWKAGGSGREVLVLGGDVHVGGHTEIKHQGNLIYRQLITSPITNRPPGLLAFLGVRALMLGEERLGMDYSFRHFDFTHRRNFGVVVARVPAGPGPAKLEGSLVPASA